MPPRSLTSLLVSMTALGCVAVAGPGSRGDAVAASGDDAAAICPGGERVGDVVRCARLFTGTQPLHLPNDPADSQRYGAFRRGGDDRFVTRNGALRITPALYAKTGADAGPSGYANTVYLATVADGIVVALSPAVTIAENAIMQWSFAGRSMEGHIGAAARRKGTYTLSRMLPIRLELSSSALKGTVAGRIVNADRTVRSTDGRCIASLAKSGARNPLSGREFTPRIRLQRRPSMHLPFDDELIARWDASASDMGASFYPSVATLIGKDPLGSVWRARIHGSPDAGPALNLRFVTGGGGRCR